MSSVSPFILTLGIVLSLSHLSACQNWPAFQAKHITGSSNIDCITVMNQPLFHVRGRCKSLNTFIHSSAPSVQAICSSVTGNRDVTSSTSFRLTNCFRASDMKPPCPYNRRPETNVICIRCENRLPVHFVKVGRC
ncbi:sialic acid-binding lectin-like [Pseudophryne corroboree]|uniref:sialic acid-binding lectin-like n=1 Tax=Pseudophryne corroboree TaxID=495146 RepID=UPI00308185F2